MTTIEELGRLRSLPDEAAIEELHRIKVDAYNAGVQAMRREAEIRLGYVREALSSAGGDLAALAHKSHYLDGHPGIRP